VTRAQSERGFTLIEVLVALLITLIGLAGVLMMQSSSVKANRQNAQFTRASMIAEEAIEAARGVATSRLLTGVVYPSQTFNGVTYAISLNAAEIAVGSNLVLVTAAVTYSEDQDTTAVDDRTARFQMLRTKTESL
jgi:prepilin-type N-terminal cleavage/methylation domain-containing protein